MGEEEFDGEEFPSARSTPRGAEAKDLLALARARIESGYVPRLISGTSLGGPSDGAACDLCGQDIAQGEPEIEVTWIRPGHKNSALVMHPLCFATWSAVAREAGSHV
jgi:hypothetical protein